MPNQRLPDTKYCAIMENLGEKLQYFVSSVELEEFETLKYTFFTGSLESSYAQQSPRNECCCRTSASQEAEQLSEASALRSPRTGRCTRPRSFAFCFIAI